ncbi:MAG: hypothetical protein JW821_09365, partial [Deltaproteobacteria bacterium]|nr:hypothetical protein [Deltaproteobacteria bacterium]
MERSAFSNQQSAQPPAAMLAYGLQQISLNLADLNDHRQPLPVIASFFVQPPPSGRVPYFSVSKSLSVSKSNAMTFSIAISISIPIPVSSRSLCSAQTPPFGRVPGFFALALLRS